MHADKPLVYYIASCDYEKFYSNTFSALILFSCEDSKRKGVAALLQEWEGKSEFILSVGETLYRTGF